jgi:hypothetical protein
LMVLSISKFLKHIWHTQNRYRYNIDYSPGFFIKMHRDKRIKQDSPKHKYQIGLVLVIIDFIYPVSNIYRKTTYHKPEQGIESIGESKKDCKHQKDNANYE